MVIGAKGKWVLLDISDSKKSDKPQFCKTSDLVEIDNREHLKNVRGYTTPSQKDTLQRRTKRKSWANTPVAPFDVFAILVGYRLAIP